VAAVEQNPRVLKGLVVEPGTPARLSERDPADRLGLGEKEDGKELLSELLEELQRLQTRLYAEDRRSVLLVLQGIDASGKDGTIRSVFTGVNPQGCRVVSFKAPSAVELAHDFLWRIHAALPARGEIGIFNRSHYEDIVTVRLLELAPEEVWRARGEHVRAFERLLVAEGTTVLKCFLHISKDEQRSRFEERLEDPEKRWKFNADDLKLRERWDEVMLAYDEALTDTSTEWAPWHVIPADRNWVRNVAMASLLIETLRRLDLRLPEPEADVVRVT
jgi:PPK2 family polyphosphate:nucleotide phosphotransferase